MRPNFFLVGASKSGTSTLYELLNRHPDIYMPEIKELHYFTHEEVLKTYYKPVLVVTNEEEYKNQFKEASTYSVAGDCTPNYLFYSGTAKKIKDFHSDAKIIIILRDPTDRAISHYFMDLNLGFHDIPLKKVISKESQHAMYREQYIGNSLYYKNVQEYLNVHSEKNVLVLDFEELKESPDTLIKKIYQFLGVHEHHSIDHSQKHNTYGKPIFNFYKMKRDSVLLTKLVHLIPIQIKSLVKKLLTNNKVEKPNFLKERVLLKERFASDVKNLSTIVPWTKKWL